MDWENLILLDKVTLDKTFIIWKFLHGRLPVDLEVNKQEWFYAVCSLCGNNVESFSYLFFHCFIDIRFWAWLKETFQDL